MSEQDGTDLKTIIGQLDLLRNFLVVADEATRQQHSAMLDEAVLVMRDIRVSINEWMKRNGK